MWLTNKKRFPIVMLLTVGVMPSFVKKWFYILKGYKIGRNVHFGFGSVIIGELVSIDDYTRIGLFAVIKSKNLKLGKHVNIGALTFFDSQEIEIGDYSIIREQVYVGGMTTPKSILKIGKNVKIFQFTVLNTTDVLTIEDNVGIGGRCSIFTHGSWQSILEGYPVQFAPVTIKTNVWLPWHVFVMPGVTINEGATIAANSLVSTDVPAFSLVAGMPAKVIKGPPEYPKNITTETKVDLFKNIIDDFVAFLKYFNVCVEVIESADYIKTKLSWYNPKLFGKKKGSTDLLFLHRNREDIRSLITNCSVLISLPTFPAETKDNLLREHVSWFDIELKESGGDVTFITKEVNSFLSRYGIRFQNNYNKIKE